jgi:trehalose 6-phosphate synthase
LFARKLIALLKPHDVIWVHDYHLIPLASELRRAGIKNRIGFFLHVPFPSYDVLRAAPSHEYLLGSLCAYDVVGFQTDRDLMSFKACVAQPPIGVAAVGDNIMQVAGGSFIADVFPIGIDVDKILALAEQAQSSRDVQRMVKSLDGRSLVIGVDRLDYSKGLTQRLLSYERLLEKYPHSRQSLVYIQIAPPTRTGVRAYDEIRAELEQTSGRINGRFAEPDWVPIRYLNRGFSRTTLAGFFRNAVVGLVTPIRDGMNLVAKEYLASQDRRDPGVLVLSSLAGAARELTEAVIVNPYDSDDVADGISIALSMSRDERRERHEAMLATLRTNDITAWRTRFVEALLAA